MITVTTNENDYLLAPVAVAGRHAIPYRGTNT
jgi:hypothetical protein